MTRCSTTEGPNKHCRCTKNLTGVVIGTPQFEGALKLPMLVVIYLCPKHFVMKGWTQP